MKITRLFTGGDGQSHFEDIEIPLNPKGDVGALSEEIKSKGIIFRETGGEYNYDWHNTPARQYVIMLEGEVEIEVGNGTKRVFGTGDILLAEDVTGQGHISRAVNGHPRRSMFVTLPE